VGNDENLDSNSTLRQEANEFNDLIMVDVNDKYDKILEKNLAAFDWVLDNCQNVIFVIKLDDDVFVNLNLLIRRLLTHKELNSNIGNFTYCNMITKARPVRNKKSKWGVDSNIYSFDFYPPYCEGFAYITNIDTLKLIKEQSEVIPRFWIDDLYLTGLLLHGLDNVKRFAFFTNNEPVSSNNSPDYQIQSYIYSRLLFDSKNRFNSIYTNRFISYLDMSNYVFVVIHFHESDKIVEYERINQVLLSDEKNISELNRLLAQLGNLKKFETRSDLEDLYFYKICQNLMRYLIEKAV
jgi:hypothetical protein